MKYLSKLGAVWLLLFLFIISNPGLTRAPISDVMPPHPRLRDQIQTGAVRVPTVTASSARVPSTVRAPSALTGSIKALAVLVDFSDKVKTVQASYFDSLIFAAPVVGRGSVRDYYGEVSYGQIDIITVNAPSSLGWRRASQTYSYYVNGANCLGSYPQNCQKLAEEIVDAIDGVVNFSNYDNDGDGYAEPIMLIHAGPGAEFTGSASDVWSHSNSLAVSKYHDGVTISDYVIMPEYWLAVSAATSDMTIGVFAHEMGHGFWSLPDLYDRDDSSEGVGNWSLMASGSWNGPATLCVGGCYSDGSSPAWPDAWSRYKMGVITPTTIASNVSGKSIPQVYNNPSPAQTVLKLKNATLASQEYFLLENRQQSSGSYDEYLPGAGLLIWHVDEAKSGYSIQNDYECETNPDYTCTQHYLVALEQADGVLQLEAGTNRGNSGDPYPGSANNRNFSTLTNPDAYSYYSSTDPCIKVNNISNSGATMTADLQVSCTVICYGLGTSSSPGAGGSVNASPAPACNGGTQYDDGVVVTLSATPNLGYNFGNWSGDATGGTTPITVTMNATKTVTANFVTAGTCYSLTTSSLPVGGGTIARNPTFNCNGNTQYSPGTIVTVTANANSGYAFNHWTGTSDTSTNPSTVTMSSAKSITATFDLVPFKYQYLPFVSKQGSASLSWTTIVSTDFESTWSSPWSLYSNGAYTWGKRLCRAYAGSYSGWVVGGGSSGTGLSCSSSYPNSVDAWMVYGPFSLSGATAADLKYKLWLNTESGYDKVCQLASLDGTNFNGTCTSGSTLGVWIDKTLDLANVSSLGNLLGQSSVWVALRFISDTSVNYSEGGYVDNIVLRKCPSGTCPASVSVVASPKLVETPSQAQRPR